ncbi:MAG: hypothetical protein ABIS18_11790 [Actinomycetota bacterium]
MIRNLTVSNPEEPPQDADPSSPLVAEVAQDLLDTMRHHDLPSISAPDIAIAIRMILIESYDGPLFILNPKIKAREAKRIYLAGMNLQGNAIALEIAGDEAQLISNEVDRLDGNL